MPMKLYVGDIIQTKKSHPCGGFLLLRKGRAKTQKMQFIWRVGGIHAA